MVLATGLLDSRMWRGASIAGDHSYTITCPLNRGGAAERGVADLAAPAKLLIPWNPKTCPLGCTAGRLLFARSHNRCLHTGRHRVRRDGPDSAKCDPRGAHRPPPGPMHR